ncbi:MAG: hypothetical protein NZ989_04060 [Bacteroidia bacterium]|nr:hypothetical protein [Bacteroidia bacterium]MDW8057266.1 hypothetical protein [Bacteroidia bacterium]
MSRVRKISKVGLLAALGVATFVACKREKEQNGPSIIIPNEQGVIASDLTVSGTDTTLRFKLIFQKGSGKDDAELKDFSFSFNSGAGNNFAFSNRPAPDGKSFTFDTSFTVRGNAGQVYIYTFSVRDKNNKTASRSIKVSFQASPPSPALVDSAQVSVSNQSDGKGSHIRYVNGTISVQSRTDAGNNPAEIIFVYFYSSQTQKHSLISPSILRNAIYDNTPVEWDNSSTRTTNFRNPPSGTSFIGVSADDIRNIYNAASDVNEFPNNGSERVECTNGRLIAFRQDNIYGLVRVESVTSNAPGARLTIKIARP